VLLWEGIGTDAGGCAGAWYGCGWEQFGEVADGGFARRSSPVSVPMSAFDLLAGAVAGSSWTVRDGGSGAGGMGDNGLLNWRVANDADGFVTACVSGWSRNHLCSRS
jgi:hypothetical protein